MTKYFIEAEYSACEVSEIDFPEGKTWEDVEDWCIKWRTLHVFFKGTDDWCEFDLSTNLNDTTNWKRPVRTSIYPEDEDGEPNYDENLSFPED